MKRDLYLVYRVLEWFENAAPAEYYLAKDVVIEGIEPIQISDVLDMLANAGFLRRVLCEAYEKSSNVERRYSPRSIGSFEAPNIYRGLSWSGYDLLEQLRPEYAERRQ